ncbi:MAG: hypothetical protein HYR64_05160 [Fimbriimonas ginsengisoli]|uniref:SD-repeat containing protein B domain-containing protein n=1 Tax=Fimbriimonas ginsengisoli TaxID=1005039 RepID=A0A931PUE9_FIMGI|nr:hypothetical protein [Fimbriimonas ginsengisoli]
MRLPFNLRCLRGVLAFVAASMLPLAALAQLPGAVFTTLPDGTTVDKNTYANCEDVYLNGGPQNFTGSGLLPGIYYFQVTTPNGATLLSTDAASNRLLLVGTNGRVDGNCDFAGTPGAGGHPNGALNVSNGSTSVQLWPFTMTTNNGGEYKAWAILARTAILDGSGNIIGFTTNPFTSVDIDGIHLIFRSKDAKTDNFKCAVQGGGPTSAVFSGHKYYDSNLSGVLDPSEAPVNGFKVHVIVYAPDGSVFGTCDGLTGTDALGNPGPAGDWSCEVQNVPAGSTYLVCEVPIAGWLQTGPVPDSSGSQCYSGFVGPLVTGLDFGNIRVARLCGEKFYDSNANGALDGGEPGIGCFKITIAATEPDGTVVNQTLYTNPDGTFCSQLFPDGTTYTVCEVKPDNSWIQTAPASVWYTGTLGPGPQQSYDTTPLPDVTNLNFGNLKLGAGGGLTLGFWSNKNGQAIMNAKPMSASLAILNALCLRNATGAHVTFSTYTAFRTWLLNATATNMAYMLSAQLAAMEMNVFVGGNVSGSSVVYAPGCGNTGLGNNFITISDLMAAANVSLCANGLTVAAGPIRTYQECLKNALDNANNNLNFVAAPITSVTCGY